MTLRNINLNKLREYTQEEEENDTLFIRNKNDLKMKITEKQL